MFILMKYSKVEGSRTHTVSRRVGVFRTRRSANKTMKRLAEREQRKSNPATFKVEHEVYFSTRVFWEAVNKLCWDWQNHRYAKLLAKSKRIQRKLNNMRSTRA